MNIVLFIYICRSLLYFVKNELKYAEWALTTGTKFRYEKI